MVSRWCYFKLNHGYIGKLLADGGLIGMNLLQNKSMYYLSEKSTSNLTEGFKELYGQAESACGDTSDR